MGHGPRGGPCVSAGEAGGGARRARGTRSDDSQRLAAADASVVLTACCELTRGDTVSRKAPQRRNLSRLTTNELPNWIPAASPPRPTDWLAGSSAACAPHAGASVYPREPPARPPRAALMGWHLGLVSLFPRGRDPPPRLCAELPWLLLIPRLVLGTGRQSRGGGCTARPAGEGGAAGGEGGPWQ